MSDNPFAKYRTQPTQNFSQFDTKLAPAEETAYAAWKNQYAPRDSGADYDLRGAFKAGLTPDPASGHWPDTFKKPNHPTFSNQSRYATGDYAAKAGRWDGENFIPPAGAADENPFAKYRVPGNDLPPAREETSPLAAAWEGLQHGIGNIAMGAGRLGAKALWSPEQNADLDKVAQFREQKFRQQPTTGQHPTATAIGEMGGEVGALGPLSAGSAGGLWSRLIGGGIAGGSGGALGAAAAAPGGEKFMPAVGRGAMVGGAVGAPLGAAGAFAENPLAARSAVSDLMRDPRGAPRPVQPTEPMGPAMRQPLALPPPTVTVAGQPAVQTGFTPGQRQAEWAGGLARQFDRGTLTPQSGDAMRARLAGLPEPGVIPPGPTSIMTAPSATPGPTRPASRLTMDVEEGPAPPPSSSTLGTAIGENKPQDVDLYLTSRYRRAVAPSVRGQRNAPDLALQDQRIMTVVDQILANRRNMQIFDDNGRQVPYPRTLRQFSDATDQTKRQIFEQYDAMARQADGSGVVVNMEPVAQMLRSIQSEPGIRTVASDVIPGLQKMADNFEREGYLSPSETQNVIETLNHQLIGYYRGGEQDFVKGVKLAPIATMLRKQLDEAVMSATGPGYQVLRNRYGALRSVEDDIAKATQREANRRYPGLLGEFADTAASAEVLRGIVTLNPHAVMHAGAIKAAQKMVRYMHGPNRAIERMFARRIATETPPSPLRQFTGSLFDRSAPGTGAETGYQQERQRTFDIAPPPGPR